MPADTLRNSHSLYAPETLPLIMENAAELIDIDTEHDWQNAEQLLAKLPLSFRLG